ncbi:hypothetical protein K474DRAFT_588318 [Panus rudis PR-1116 ss-1]|nr:hypothetical protein K474DRAFT_588318 [Panus rudis PR-1116 ss-1]
MVVLASALLRSFFLRAHDTVLRKPGRSKSRAISSLWDIRIRPSAAAGKAGVRLGIVPGKTQGCSRSESRLPGPQQDGHIANVELPDQFVNAGGSCHFNGIY